MRLLYITYRVDAGDSLVGHAVGWINELARRVTRVEVICLAAGPAVLAGNVGLHSLGKERGAGRLRRAIRFYRTLWALRSAVDIVFCQFSPEYVLAVAPLAKWKRWPVVLWYTHRHAGWRLRLATALADRVVTASAESFRLLTPKLRIVGHGIDTGRFSPGSAAPDTPPVILAVGRRSPIKRYELLIDAVRILVRDLGRSDVRVRIVGGDEGGAPSGYADQLQARIDRSGLSQVVTLVGPVSYDAVPQEYRLAAVHVNLCPTGGLDKAVIEGMACGVPTLVRNETFRPILGEAANELWIGDDEARAVAERLDRLLGLPDAERQLLGGRLRRIVVDEFSQQALADRLAAVLSELTR